MKSFLLNIFKCYKIFFISLFIPVSFFCIAKLNTIYLVQYLSTNELALIFDMLLLNLLLAFTFSTISLLKVSFHKKLNFLPDNSTNTFALLFLNLFASSLFIVLMHSKAIMNNVNLYNFLICILAISAGIFCLIAEHRAKIFQS